LFAQSTLRSMPAHTEHRLFFAVAYYQARDSVSEPQIQVVRDRGRAARLHLCFRIQSQEDSRPLAEGSWAYETSTKQTEMIGSLQRGASERVMLAVLEISSLNKATRTYKASTTSSSSSSSGLPVPQCHATIELGPERIDTGKYWQRP
jgi:hypothetical protein